jgi:hypothetical protein
MSAKDRAKKAAAKAISRNGYAPSRTPKREAASRRKAAKAKPESWEEPLPLAEIPAPLPFPVEVLPDKVAGFIRAVAAALPCPPDYVGLPVLAIAGAAIGASRALQIKPGWSERPSLYAAVVAPPSSAKTPAVNAACKPVYREQNRLHQLYRKKLQAYKDDIEPDKPVETHLCVSDCTVEKLADVLHDTLRGVVMIRDELTAWVNGMNQYKGGGKGADRQFYLSAWAGEPISVHRKNQLAGAVFVAHPFLSVLGGLPPDLLARLRGEKDVCDGFFDRILFAYPEPMRASAEDWACVEDERADDWREVVNQLYALKPLDDEEGQRPRFIHFNTDGRHAWEAYTQRLANEMNNDSFPDVLRGPWGKHKGYAARLALIVHCLRAVSGDSVDADAVDGESVKRADKLIAYFQSHARKIYAAIDADPKVADAKRVLTWLAQNVNSVNSVNGSRVVSKRDIHAQVLGSRRTVEEAGDIISLLVKHGYLRLLLAEPSQGPGRKPSPRYEIHPHVFSARSLTQTGSQNSQNSRNRESGEGD